jgi:DNA polymerase elongation subunit (family B)
MAETWVFDCEADMARSEMVLWLPRSGRAEPHRFRAPLTFYAHARRGGLAELQRALQPLEDVLDTAVVQRRLSLEHPRLRRVLEVRVHRYAQFRRIAMLIDGRGGFRDYALYNVDLDPAARFLAARGLFPLARCTAGLEPLDDAWALEYELPPLRVLDLEAEPAAPGPVRTPDDAVGRVRLGEQVLEERDGDEAALLRSLERAVRAQDPHALLTRDGDERLFPWLHQRVAACGLGSFELGRAPSPLAPARRAKSYFTYGRIAYRAPSYPLRGRWHIDAGNSFFHGEGRLAGILDLARISGMPVQTAARLGAGSAITMMQVHKALAMGFLVPWKKNRPEDFKSGLQLLATDKGGYVFEPRVGLHEGAVELDFASMYPHIMVSRNISAETLNCACCARGEGLMVPGLDSWTCARRIGLVPRYMKPLIERRFHFKARAKALAASDPHAAEAARGIQNCLKWCLLVSFGYQGYRNARFGRLECHEAISAWARDILLRAAEEAEQAGWQVLHGIVDSLWVKPARGEREPVEDLARRIGAMADFDLAVEGAYSWIVFLPNKTDGARELAARGLPEGGPGARSPRAERARAERAPLYVGAVNRYYGRFEDGTLKARGVEVRRSDTCAFVARFQEALLALLGEARTREEFFARVPEGLRCLRAFAREARRGAVPGEELALGSTVSQPLEQYRALTDAVSALRQLAEHGAARQPGQWVSYVVTDHASKDPRRKAKPAELWRPEHGYDAAFYVRRLARAAESLLLPFGWTEERLLASLDAGGAARLEDFAAAPARAMRLSRGD